MSSPSVFRAPILLDEKRQQQHVNDSYQQNNHSKKRRPIDPPEDLTFGQNDEYNDTNYTNKRRRTSPDDLLGTLSLKPPDPPAHSHCKRKKEDDDDDSVGISSDGDDRRCTKQPRCQDGDDELQEDGTMQSKRMANDETSQVMSSSTKPDPPADITQQQNTSEVDKEMSIDDNCSINSNSDGSISEVSEGSLQRAMYAAVFGRRNNAQNHFHSVPTTTTSNHVAASGCCYDAVDSKIEDIIRRSRIEAEIRSRKEDKQATTTEGGVCRSQDLADEDEKMEMDG